MIWVYVDTNGFGLQLLLLGSVLEIRLSFGIARRGRWLTCKGVCVCACVVVVVRMRSQFLSVYEAAAS